MIGLFRTLRTSFFELGNQAKRSRDSLLNPRIVAHAAGTSNACTSVAKGFSKLSPYLPFESVRVGDWGHSIVWSTGAELGADTLWLETLSVKGHDDARTLLEWRLRHGPWLSGTAEARGLARCMIAYCSNGEKPLPKPVLLACKVWEVGRAT